MPGRGSEVRSEGPVAMLIVLKDTERLMGSWGLMVYSAALQ